MIKTKFNIVWKRLTGFDNNRFNGSLITAPVESDNTHYISIEDANAINDKIIIIEKDLKATISEFRAHEAIEHPIIDTESLKHDIGILNSIVKGINTRLDQIDNRNNNNKPENVETLNEKELFDLQHLTKEKGEYHRLKAKANRVYEKTGYVPPGFMIDAKKKLRRNLNMKGKSRDEPNSCKQFEENNKSGTILKEFAYKGAEKTAIGVLDTPN